MNELKPYRSISEQVEILVSRQMVIADKESAESYLFRRNYYRLNVYFHCFLKRNSFNRKVSFGDIMKIESTDSEIRHLLFRYIESIELDFRTKIGYFAAKAAGADGFYTGRCFQPANAEAGKQLVRTKHAILFENATRYPDILHHKNKYARQLPAWVTVEHLSFSDLSRIFTYLEDSIQKQISDEFGAETDFIKSWLHCLSVIRNICAHHGYFFRRKLDVRPKLLSRHSDMYTVRKRAEGRIFEGFLSILNLLRDDEQGLFLREANELMGRVFNQIKEIYGICPDDYGFPENWQEVLFRQAMY